MPSKQHAQSRDRTTAKQHPARHEAQDYETVDWLQHPATIVQRAALAPGSLTPADVLQLQSTVGNQAVQRLLGRRSAGADPTIIQRDGPRKAAGKELRSWGEFERAHKPFPYDGTEAEKEEWRKEQVDIKVSSKEYVVLRVGQDEYRTSKGAALFTGAAQTCVIVGIAAYNADGNASMWGLGHFDSDFDPAKLNNMIGDVKGEAATIKGWVVGGPDSNQKKEGYDSWPSHPETLYVGVKQVLEGKGVPYEAGISTAATSAAMRPVPDKKTGKMVVRFRQV